MAGKADKAKNLIEQAEGTPKKKEEEEESGVKPGSGKRSRSEQKDGSAVADRAKRAAKEFLR